MSLVAAQNEREVWLFTVKKIKSLFNLGQYRQCATRCEQILSEHPDIHPVHASFFSFYAGLSYDSLARSMSIRSPLLSKTIDQAEEFYLAASTSLPMPQAPNLIIPSAEEATHCADVSSESSNSPVSKYNRSSVDSGTSINSAVTDSSSVYSTDLGDFKPELILPDPNAQQEAPPKEQNLLEPEKPSPLRVSKPLSGVHISQFFSPRRSISPAKTKQRGSLSPPMSSFYAPLRVEANDESAPNSPERRMHRYSSHILDFSAMIQHHIVGMREFRKSLRASQIRGPTFLDSASSSTSSLNSIHLPRVPMKDRVVRFQTPEGYNGQKEMSAMEKQERILRGRENGWARERFDPKRYEDLCEKAIAEL
ncbi:hypothetical protein K402DRAFT_401770 [Aulographum hederae CBS 113979]|uniref:Uncharacterized protein n=1 Tax=Aulographum hederae CBS 113979 TaxID=1176131 RepID=A0A6G1H9D3_9PEZI|nr:hypothetical protein K402DRAFT_401770 [Aulographum hederae CBS 113979]